MSSAAQFRMYTNPRDQSIVTAARVTSENVQTLAQIVGSATFVAGKYLIVVMPNGESHKAEVGDYIISDWSRGYKAVDQDTFEANYSKYQDQ